MAFRGFNDILYQNNNGNFLSAIQIIAKFDPVIQKHVKRITDTQTHIYYLRQNSRQVD